MHHYVLSYDLKDSKTFNGTYRTQIINFLLEGGAKDIDSYIASTIYFSSEKNRDFWDNELIKVRNDIYFHYGELKAPIADLPVMQAWYDGDHKSEFDNERDVILNERNPITE